MIENIPSLVQIIFRAEAETVDRDYISAHHADDIADQNQYRQHDRSGNHSRGDEVFERVNGKSPQGVDLLGHAHRADFRRDGGTDASGDHQARQNGGQFTRDREDNDPCYCAFGVEAGEARITLQGQNHPGKEGGHAHNGKRIITDVNELPRHLRWEKGRGETMAQRPDHEKSQIADRLREGQNTPAQILAEVQKQREGIFPFRALT